jgi:hypothetical protein
MQQADAETFAPWANHLLGSIFPARAQEGASNRSQEELHKSPSWQMPALLHAQPESADGSCCVILAATPSSVGAGEPVVVTWGAVRGKGETGDWLGECLGVVLVRGYAIVVWGVACCPHRTNICRPL